MLYIVLFIVSLGISVSAMPFLKRLALKYGAMIAVPNERNIHVKAVPRNGGIGIALASFIAVVAGLAMRRIVYSEELLQVTGIILGGVFILLLGIRDDMRNINAYKKISGQIFAAIILILFGVRIWAINIPFWHVVHLPLTVSIFVTVLWMLTVTNALNLIDGIDGLAGGVASIASLVLFIIALINGRVLMAVVSASLIGSCLGFLKYNYPPASIFMGDCGSMFLGFTLAAVSIQCSCKSATAASILIPVTILGVPLADTTLAVIRRLRRHVSPFRADREHIHHQLLDLGLSQKISSLILYGFCGFLGLVALIATIVGDDTAVIIITVAGLILVIVSISIPQYAKKRNGVLKENSYIQRDTAREELSHRVR